MAGGSSKAKGIAHVTVASNLIERVLDDLFRYADQGTFLSLRVFDQFDRTKPPIMIRGLEVNGDARRMIQECVWVAQLSADYADPTVFAPPICTFANATRARLVDLANGLVLSVELDEQPIESLAKLKALLGEPTMVVRSGGDWVDPDTGKVQPKMHAHYRLSEPTRTADEHAQLGMARKLACSLVGADPTGSPPAHPYRWAGSWNRKGTPRLADIVGGNEAREIHLIDTLDVLLEAVAAAGLSKEEHHQSNDPAAPIEDLRAAMAAIPNPDDKVPYTIWIKYGYACYRATGGSDKDGFDLWDAWSRKSNKYNASEQDAAWKRIRHAIEGSSAPRTVGAGTIYYHAGQHGWRPTRPKILRQPQPSPQSQRGGPAAGADEAGHVWTDELAKHKGKPLRTLSNALIAFRIADVWQGVFAWNEFSSRVMVLRHMPGHYNPALSMPRELTESDVSNATDWLQRADLVVASSVTLEAIRTVADEHRYHPVRQYLDGLKWDGTKRLDDWLIRHLGAEDTPLNRAFSIKWPIGAVARVMRPGCKLDTALILESEKQGLMKSTVLATLAGQWFTDHVPDLGTKDAQQQLQGVWIIELSELSSLSRSETHRAKAFLSARVDRFRPSFGRFAIDHPRQCAFGGTVNLSGSGYLRDETGNRRFWTVECAVGWNPDRKVDMAALEDERDQFWAEAMHRYRAGERWWLDTPTLEQAQAEAAEERFEDDAREGLIRDQINGRKWIRMAELFGEDCLNVPTERQTRALQTEIGRIIRSLKWRRGRRRISKTATREYVYLAPGVRITDVVDAQ